MVASIHGFAVFGRAKVTHTERIGPRRTTYWRPNREVQFLMSLAARCQHCFDHQEQDRGSRVYAGHSVHVLDVDPDAVEALVDGSGGNKYEVYIDLSGAREGDLTVDCSCRRFEDGSLCKHIWATILLLDDDSVSGWLPGTGPLHVSGDWGDGWEDESNDLLHDMTTSLFHAPTDLQARGPDHSSLPEWKRQLRLVSQHSEAPHDVSELWKELSPKRREVWYVLNASASVEKEALVVEFFQRETKKSGDWGKIKKLSIRRKNLDGLSNAEDRQLLGLLLGNEVGQNEYGYYGQYRYLSGSYSSISVLPPMFDFVLPRLCAAERFVWLLDSSLPIEEADIIRWDAGEPWKFRLGIESDAHAECWRISGQFYRDDATFELGDVILATADGLILFPGKLARFDGEQDSAWIRLLQSQRHIEVPFADRERLLHQLSLLSHLPSIAMPEDLHVEQVVERPTGRLSIKAAESGRYGNRNMSATVSFDYEGGRFRLEDPQRGVFDEQHGRFVMRCRDTERDLLDQLKDAGARPARSYSHSEKQDVEFHQAKLVEITRCLIRHGWTVESEGIKIRQPGSFQLNVTSDVDWFELDGQLDFDGVSASFPTLLQALRTGDQFIRLDDGSQGMLPEQWLEKYGRLAKLGTEDGETLRFSSSQALLLDALLAEQEHVQVDQGFEQLRLKLRSFDGVKPLDEPRGFSGELREYQREGVGWLEFLRDFNFGGCLADDMGLGKTVQVLALLQARRARRLKDGETRSPSIVVVPKSLVFNWMDEAARFTPRLQILNYTGAQRPNLQDVLAGFNVVVTTYGTLRRDIVQLKDIHFEYAILDESQAIKNHNSQAAKACRLLQADHRLAMTGTPIENHLGELWSLFEFLNPGMLGSSTAFTALAKSGQDSDNSGLPLLGQALRPFVLRRTKEQVLSELPEKTEQTLLCEMPAKQRKQYDELREYFRAQLSDRVAEFGIKKSKIHVLEALLRLRQAACHPGLLDEKKVGDPSAKIDTLLEQLDEILAEGHKALVFSQFTSLLAIVRKRLDARKVVYEYLDGRTRKRAEKVKRFQQDQQCPLFLISLKAGGQGLNLTAADYVFILDPWWNPAVEAQAVDRAHRIGQQRRVFAYRLICRDTVEEKILELQRGKRKLADAIISADNSIIRDLTADDLQLLLS